MTQDDLTLLHEHGFAADVLVILTHLGYKLDHHDTAAGAIEVSVADHGFTLNRQDPPKTIREHIFSAGVFRHEKQTRDALQSLATAAGIQLA